MIATIDRGQVPTKVSPIDSKSNGELKKPHGNYSKSESNNQLSFAVVRQAAYGQWQGIHIAAGAKPYSTNHRHHTKCYCGGGKDRMRILPDYASTGRWYCNGGGDSQSGDGFSWLCHALHWTLAESLKFVADYLGLSKMDYSERQKIRELAGKQAAKIAEMVKAKDAVKHRNHDLKNLAEDLIDAIKYREYLQRLAGKTGSFDIISDTEEEHRIAKAIVNIYASQYREVQHHKRQLKPLSP